MAEEVPPSDPTDLPARMRVHALAKTLGVTSKLVLAQLDAHGAAVKSVQSSVDRATAEAVRDALAPASAGATPVADLSTARVDSAPVPIPATTDEDAPEPGADVVAPLFLPPEPVKAAPRRRRATRPAAGPDAATADSSTGSDGTGTAGTGSEAPVPETPAPESPAESPAPESPAAEVPGQGDDGTDEDGSPRRRRRGRRGRGRGRGPQDENDQTDSGDDAAEAGAAGLGDGRAGDTSPPAAGSAETASQDTGSQDTGSQDAGSQDTGSQDAAAGDSDTAEAEDDDAGSGTRRRRRRRRRKSGADGGVEGDGESGDNGDADDPADTVVHEREPRSKSRRSRSGGGGSSSSGGDEVQGITGSTRLEAKRQRRKDGRDQGRKRPPILSEAEFLARREAVARTMVVRDRGGKDSPTQVAVLEDGVLVEHFVTSSSTPSLVGNVYLGRVQNVLPSMEAAFIDIGRGRNGVLYAGEVDWDAAGLAGRSRKIEQALSSGDHVLVQVSKDPVGHKGARLTTQISLPGRFLVYVPGGTSAGISRKLPDTERSRLKAILKRIVPEDAGVIIRTASEGVSEDELARDVDRLAAQWESISAAGDTAKESGQKSPHSLYEEPDLLVKVVRDLFNSDVAKVVVSGDGAWQTVSRYVEDVSPDLADRLDHHEGSSDVFADFRIDEQLVKAMERKVNLPSGGSLVIDRTEAMTVVDVNTGKYTGSGGNLEETVTRNNLEAAEEVVRQLRLRDIGGMIVVDFIDMVLEGNRDLVLRRLTECLGRDRTRHQVSEVTSLGLVQLTRKKLGMGLVESFSTPCEHCHGRGVIVAAEPVQAPTGGPRDGGGAARDSGADAAKRSRRGRSDPTPETPPARVVPKGPHPASLAAAKAAAGTEDGDAVGSDAAKTDPLVSDSLPSVTGSAPQPVDGSEAESAATVEPADVSGTQAPAPRARRSRRASRPTAAPDPVAARAESLPPVSPEPAEAQPASEAATEIVTAPADSSLPDDDATPAAAPEPAAHEPVAAQPVAPVAAVRPRRRRAAGRPAGPPVDVDA